MDIKKHEKVRNEFKWGQNLDKNNKVLNKTNYKKLKDISDNHLISICVYFTKRLLGESEEYMSLDISIFPTYIRQWTKTHLTFLNEIKYRKENNITIEDDNI